MTKPVRSYEVLFTPDARQEVLSLDGSIKKRLKKVLLDKIAVDPSGYGSPLGGVLSGYWKHEFASHRVIYRIYDAWECVIVCAVGKRLGQHVSDIYERFSPIVRTGRVLEQVQIILASLKPKK